MESAAGSALYGDVSFILNTSFAENASLYSAIDTGEWSALCPWYDASSKPTLAEGKTSIVSRKYGRRLRRG